VDFRGGLFRSFNRAERIGGDFEPTELRTRRHLVHATPLDWAAVEFNFAFFDDGDPIAEGFEVRSGCGMR